MRKQLFVLPLIAVAMVAVFAWRGLSIDGTTMPSALIGQPAPAVSLEKIPGYAGPFDPTDLGGEVALVNIWGSWCVNCLYEHPLFLELAAEGVPIYGLAWNDTPEAAAGWLTKHGNPYRAVGLDQTGRAVVEFGITGAPETFVIDAEGVVHHRVVGAVTPQLWKRTLQPLMQKLTEEAEAKAAVAEGEV
ncbi:MAG: DsbE family thiol:disulfide interchange protein [Parvularcula sp.]|jgi:cytochrome c biogenesis protein CcmG/thiol:disulfide interchange protein DsbE|nr:DsbE family thiol:disulfide interchange protein [Parvularcula sp.]